MREHAKELRKSARANIRSRLSTMEEKMETSNTPVIEQMAKLRQSVPKNCWSKTKQEHKLLQKTQIQPFKQKPSQKFPSFSHRQIKNPL